MKQLKRMEKFKTYLRASRLGQRGLARLMGVSEGLVWLWVNGRAPVPAERCLMIERLTLGNVTRHDLRPDIFSVPEIRPARSKNEVAAA